jgi:hypothetical protein
VLAFHAAFRLIRVIILDHPTKRHEFPLLESHSILHTGLNICSERDLSVCIFAVFHGVGVRDDVPNSVNLQ